MSSRVTIAVLIVVLAIGLLAAYVKFVPCEVLLPLLDSPQLESTESRELWIGLQQAHQDSLKTARPGSALFPLLPSPIKVASIRGRSATIVLDGPMPQGQVEGDYGGAWQAVFARHHGGNWRSCVYVRYIWPGGRSSTVCCMSQL